MFQIFLDVFKEHQAELYILTTPMNTAKWIWCWGKNIIHIKLLLPQPISHLRCDLVQWPLGLAPASTQQIQKNQSHLPDKLQPGQNYLYRYCFWRWSPYLICPLESVSLCFASGKEKWIVCPFHSTPSLTEAIIHTDPATFTGNMKTIVPTKQ